MSSKLKYKVKTYDVRRDPYIITLSEQINTLTVSVRASDAQEALRLAKERTGRSGGIVIEVESDD